MATSSSTNFELDVADYIEEAFERCGLEVKTGYDLKTAKRSLNLMLAEWSNRGLNQWTIQQTSITMASGIAEYPAGTLTMTVGASGSFTVGETITGSSSSATASITSLPSSGTMAITIPSGTFTSGETITGGTSSATTTVSAAVDLTNVQSTIDLLSVVVTRDSTDFSLNRISRDDYISIPSKDTTGRSSQFFVDRQVTPSIKLYPTPDDTYTIVYDRLTRIDDADTFVNTLDVPFRFYPCLSAGLAYYLALKKAPERVQILKAVYEEEFERAMTEDRDRASFLVVPEQTFLGNL